jgi:hypothetical protein
MLAVSEWIQTNNTLLEDMNNLCWDENDGVAKALDDVYLRK